MYASDTTLGQGKGFLWLMNDVGGIEIRRTFRTRDGQRAVVSGFSREELGRLHSFVSGREWTDLANNVEKLYKGTEKEGLGRFIQDVLGKSRLDAQAASQLSSLFVRAGVWARNNRQRGMSFQSLRGDWGVVLRGYYERQMSWHEGEDGV